MHHVYKLVSTGNSPTFFKGLYTGLEIAQSTHINRCGALSKVPVQIYSFLIEVPLMPEKNCRAPLRAKFKACKYHTLFLCFTGCFTRILC